MDNTHKGETSLIELIRRGGDFRIIPGATPRDLLANLIGSIDIPPSVDRAALLSVVLEREALMPTAVGNGIALPHPRNPMIAESAEQFVSIAFAERGINWGALDGKPVRTVMLILSASPRMHLHTLSRLNYFCQQASFVKLLERRASPGEILQIIEETEKTWLN
ncbi:MAG: PTS sugar transporter subunit IIA [Treponema sp.]|nr:PTS sugar transporter subunit IIA [Treponema sp.]